MKRTKFIHILLIAVLCYTQLVASFHVVGHLEVPDVHASDHFSFQNHNDLTQATASSLTPHQHADTHAHDDHSTEKDCALYHAVASLNGVFIDVQPTSDLSAPSTVTANYAAPHLTGATLEHQRIRAPPRYS